MQHKDQKPKHVKKTHSKKPDTCNEFSRIYPPDMCAILPLEGENPSCVRLTFNTQLKRRALIQALVLMLYLSLYLMTLT